MEPQLAMKKFLIFGFGIVFLFVSSETVNFLFNSDSPSSQVLITHFIRKAVDSSKERDLNKSLRYLHNAKRINIYGEYFKYRKMGLPTSREILPIPKDEALRNSFLEYISNISNNYLGNSEDSGLGKIYYDLGILTYSNNENNITPLYFESALSNNPDFPAFHAELINYYFSLGDLETTRKLLDECLRFQLSKIICNQYGDDMVKYNIPKEVGYLKDAVEAHYESY